MTNATFADLPGMAGTDLGWSSWLEVTQDRINTFADATDDHQWIHTDPERAKDGPFGASVAHGFLTLSLAVAFWTELFDVSGVGVKVNYGLDKVRFVSPVLAGSRVRMNAIIAEVQEVKGGYQLVVDQTIAIDGVERPALVARGVYRFYGEA